MTPAEIKKTRLYRTLAPCVRKEDREELARMLALVPERSMNKGFGASRIGDAFWWSHTPQGALYWIELNERLFNAGHCR